jgi:hypothetical protein
MEANVIFIKWLSYSRGTAETFGMCLWHWHHCL